MRRVYSEYYSAIRSYRHDHGRIQQIYNRELTSEDSRDLEPELWAIFNLQKNAFKVNFSYGFILRNIETGELRYYHASQNNTRLLDVSRLIRNEEDFTEVLEELRENDVLEFVRQQRENTKWIVDIVTNMSIYVNPVKDHPIGAALVLPDYIKYNKGIVGLVADYKTGRPFDDKLCIFRCVALALGYTRNNFKKTVDRFAELYPKGKEGVTLGELPKLERLFNVKINVWKLDEDGTAERIRCSASNYETTCNVNLFEEHFSYIIDLELYSKSYRCGTCDKLWKSGWSYERHQATCTLGIKHHYSGGTYQTPPTVWEELEELGIVVEDRLFPHRATYDIEVYFTKEALPKNTEKVTWVAKHHLLSVSVASNVPGYEEPVCFVTEGDPSVVVTDFVTHLEAISEESYTLLRDHYDWVFEALDEEDEGLKTKLDGWLHQLPVISFNGGRYDLNVLKKDLMTKLEVDFVVKKGQNFMCIGTELFRFLDISNYLAAGCSYDKYIKAYNCTQQKGFFPYEWMDDLGKLNDPALPPRSAFFSQLKNEGLSHEDYEYLQRVWEERGMTSVRDLLVWYNNLDVVPMLEAIEKQCAFFGAKGIDMFKDGISLPGLCQKYLFTFPDEKTVFALADPRNEDLYHMLRDSIVGGPSIVFHRYHHAGKTKIRPADYGEDAKSCERILGLDANALYLWAIMQDMPTGFPTRYVVEGDGTVKSCPQQKYGRMGCDWMDSVAEKTGTRIKHMRNSREKTVGGIPVDGWCPTTRTVYQFHGCFWHGCPCQGVGVNAVNGKSFAVLREETRKRSEDIKKAGYKLVEKWECDWDGPVPTVRKLNNTQEILDGVMDGSLFGFVQCDIHVPDELKERFAEMPPIFKNTTLKREDIGEFMMNYAVENGIMKQPRRSLIGSYFGKKILLSTPLLRWYREHGLIVTRVYEFVQYDPKACFESFGQEVSSARRDGDVSPDKAIIADSMKLLGNSSYGKTLTNVFKHRDVTYCSEDDAETLVNDKRFVKLEKVGEELYEVERMKANVKVDLPVQIGIQVYQNAKLRMLQMYYDFMLNYIDPRDFQMVEMDTDSLYFAVSGSTLEAVIRPELRETFYREKHLWFPSESCDLHREAYVQAGGTWDPPVCCSERRKYDVRTPGLFKMEWEGDGIIALCSKTYYCLGETSKASTKGLSKRQNEITFQNFVDVLEKQKSGSGVNRGFRVHAGDIYTYTQIRGALTYFYPKRKVLDDGVSTVPLCK